VTIAGLWGYMSITATPLHPNPQDVLPSVRHSAPLPKWADAVEQGRRPSKQVLPNRTYRDCQWRSA